MTKQTRFLFIFHILSFVSGTVLFILLFRFGVLRSMNVFIYRGITVLILACLLLGAGLYVFRRRYRGYPILSRDIVFSALGVFCINLVFFTHFPVTADRSITIFILSSMNAHGDRFVTKEEITSLVADIYINEHDAVNKRFAEQVTSGNIQKADDGYRISRQGRMLMRLYHVIADVFLLSTENLQDE